MSRRKIGKIMPVSATSPANPVAIGQTNSILTDPDGRWVAKRQSDINAAQEQYHPGRGHSSEGDLSSDNGTTPKTGEGATGHENSVQKLSGESDRIGDGNWDEDIPFGKHVGYL